MRVVEGKVFLTFFNIIRGWTVVRLEVGGDSLMPFSDQAAKKVKIILTEKIEKNSQSQVMHFITHSEQENLVSGAAMVLAMARQRTRRTFIIKSDISTSMRLMDVFRITRVFIHPLIFSIRTFTVITM